MQYLLFGRVFAPRTLLAGIRKLSPGETLIRDERTGNIQVRRCRRPWATDGGVWFEALERSLAACLREIPDEHLGVALSGGVDSSLLTALAVKKFDRKPQLLCLGIPTQGYDERKYAEAAARHCGLPLETALLDGNPVDLLRDVWPTMDEPLGDTSVINGLILGRAARARSLRVLLSGEGGDELFGGYHAYRVQRTAARCGGWVGKLAARCSPPAGFWDGLNPNQGKRGWRNSLRALLAGFAWPAAWEHLRWQAALSPRALADFCGVERVEATLQDVAATLAEWDRVTDEARVSPFAESKTMLGLRMRARDVQGSLPDWLLPKADAWSRANGVQMRFPFLSPEIIGAALGLADEELWGRGGAKGSGGKKAILEHYGPLLPQETVRRKKEGFSAPFKIWLRTDDRLCAYLIQDLFSDGGPLEFWEISPAAARKWTNAHRRGTADRALAVFSLAVLAGWTQHNFS
jgi:asparagine synthase (glutamine-hydrolysing)